MDLKVFNRVFLGILQLFYTVMSTMTDLHRYFENAVSLVVYCFADLWYVLVDSCMFVGK